MRVVIAPDSFKECLAAPEVARALEAGWLAVFPDDEVRRVPMADGGEGTVDALVSATGGRHVGRRVRGPLGDPVDAVYGLLGDGETAVVEMAAASGLALVAPERRDPARAGTQGTGELIADALDRGVSRIIVGIGGSATNDGGAGMAEALGCRFLDETGVPLPPGGAALARLARIETGGRHQRLGACRIDVACDVDNPLCGPAGASHVYGPQKGATPEMADRLDAALRHYGEVVREATGVDVLALPGGGAAGGLGAGLAAFAGARLCSGVDLVAEASGLAAHVAGAGLVITGEGRLDAQSAHGKAPAGVARMARAAGVPVVVAAGALGDGYERIYDCGAAAAFCIARGPGPLDMAIADTPERLRAAAETIARLWRAAANRAT